MFRLKRSPADKLFSDYIRTRDDWTCQRCFRQYDPPTISLHCSHFHGRGKKSVRFDPENAVALCFGCHQHMGAHPQEHRDFFFKRLGEKKYDALTIRANTPQRVDEKFIAMGIREQLRLIKNSKNR